MLAKKRDLQDTLATGDQLHGKQQVQVGVFGLAPARDEVRRKERGSLKDRNLPICQLNQHAGHRSDFVAAQLSV
jgi:hypothetical protein